MLPVVNAERHLVANVGSPYMMALLSYALFLFAWIFPGTVYTDFLHEPDLLRFDPLTFAYFTACVITFLLGVYAAHYFSARPQTAAATTLPVRDSLVYLIAPMATATVLCVLYIREVNAHVNFVALLQSQQAEVIKAAQIAGQIDVGRVSYAYSLPFLTGTVWWALYRSGQVTLEGIDRWVFRALVVCALVVGVVAYFSIADRGNQLIFIVGVIVVSLHRRSLGRGMRLGKLIINGVLSTGIIMTVFFTLAFMRGKGSAVSLTTSLMGYSIASYNRLAALLSGQMTYIYHGTGVYLAPYLLDRHKLNSVLHIAQIMNWPTSGDVWISEFRSVAAAGLNFRYIWSGEFGYLYSDLGWGALVYLFLAGIMVGYAWTRFKAGGGIALVIYPFTAFWILFWVSATSLFDHPIVELLEVGVALMLWDKLWIRKRKYVSSAREQIARLHGPSSGVRLGQTAFIDGSRAH